MLALALSADDAGANRFIQSDTFIDTLDGTPDPEKWTVSGSGPGSTVLIDNGELQTNVEGPGYAYCIQKKRFSNDNLSLQLDYKAEVVQGRAFELTLSTRDDTSSHMVFQVKFDSDGWSYRRRLNGQTDEFFTSQYTLAQGTWYSCKLEVLSDVVNFTMRQRTTSSVVLSLTYVAVDSMLSENWVNFGVMSEASGLNPEACWDEFHLYDPVADPNTNPRWWTVPTLRAVEDVPYSHDFTPYVSDDQEPWELSVSSTSDYVTGADGLTAHFLFPNNVTATAVTLLLTDGYAIIPNAVTFFVTPVNDPPELGVPPMVSIYRGDVMVLDFANWVWDVDNYKSQLTLISYSEYCNANGMKVSFSFPANVTSYTFAFGVNDGTNVSRGSVLLFISDTLQPPTITDLDDVVVNEDTLLVIDLAANLSDPDTPKNQLTLVSQNVNVSVDGLSIHVLYTKGGFQETVVIQVHDGIMWDETSFEVTIVEVDDEPVIEDIPVMNISEDEETVVNLLPYVSDEETPTHLLAIECMHENLVDQSGKTLLFLYLDPVEDHVVHFYVSDGLHRKGGMFTVHVVEVNDAPRILSIGGHTPPVAINLTAHMQRTYVIDAVDSDDNTLTIRVEASWDGISVEGDFLTLTASEAGLGPHTAHVVATDPRGGYHRLPITFMVLPVDEFPVTIAFESPINHSTMPAGLVLEIGVRVDDPYKLLEYPIRVDFSSDRDGDMNHIFIDGSGTLWAGSLSDGRHRITAELTDGNRRVTAWIEVQVGEVAEPVGTSDVTLLYIVIVIIIILMIMAAVAMSSTSSTQRDTKAFGEVVRQAEMAKKAVTVEADDRDSRILRERERDERSRLTREAAVLVGSDTAQDATTGPQSKPTAPSLPAARVTTSRRATSGGQGLALPTDSELEAQLPIIKAAIEALPRGMPSELSLFDPATIAKRIVKGRRKWSKTGQLVAFIQGEWYYADPTDVTTFLRQYDE